MSLYLGIDFGTSTLYITRWNPQKQDVEEIPNLSGLNKRFIDNAIYYESPTNFIVGELALKKGMTHPENCVRNIKRCLDDPTWRQFIPALNQEIEAMTVVRDVFLWLKGKIESQTGSEKIEGVVISIPFAFKQLQRLCIKQAAEAAGLNILHLIEEPVAAAISYSLAIPDPASLATPQTLLVFDFGGGTLDVSIFKLAFQQNQLVLDVLNTDGHATLGGVDLDTVLFEKFKQALPETWHHIPETERVQDHFKLMTEAKLLKENLTESDEEYVMVEGLQKKHYLEIESVTPNEFNDWIRQTQFVENIHTTLHRVLDEIHLLPQAIDKIILVGGTCHVPLVVETVTQFFNQAPETTPEAITMVGKGAGLYAGKLISKSLTYEVKIRSSHAVGLLLKQGIFSPLIQRNERYGIFSAPKMFRFKPGTKQAMSMKIYQGELAQPETWQHIGTIYVPYCLFPEHVCGVQLALAEQSGIVKYRLLDSKGQLKKEGEVIYESF